MAMSPAPLLKPALVAGVLGMANLATADTDVTPLPADAPAYQEIRGALVVRGLSSAPGEITLPYILYRTPGKPRPTVFFMGGGPGIGNLKNTPPAEWLRDFDVAVLEYRGVGKSSLILNTPHFARGLLKLKGSLSLEGAAPMKQAFRDAFADLRRQNVSFNDFSVKALADDLEQLRQELNIPYVYLVGHSFGTRIALSYQTRYRNRVAGSILFAMNTPGGFIWEPRQTQHVLQRYRDYLARSNPEQARHLTALLETPNRPSEWFGILPVNDAKARFVAFFMSFNSWTRDWSMRALASSLHGHSGYWLLFSESYNWFIRFGFNWADFFLKAYTADCDRDAIQRVDAQGKNAVFQSPSSVLFVGTDAYEAAGGRCSPDAFEPDFRNTLAINGEFDTTTPIERKPAALPDDRFIVIQGAGHADIFYPDQNATAVWLRRFFLHPDQSQPPAEDSPLRGNGS